MNWTIATAAALATSAAGAATENGALMLFPLFAIPAIGLIQEWVCANTDQHEPKNVEEASSERGATVVAGDFHTGRNPSLERVIDPLPQTDEQPSEADKDDGFVFNALEINCEGEKKDCDTYNRGGLVPVINDERLERVCHNEVANVELNGVPLAARPSDRRERF